MRKHNLLKTADAYVQQIANDYLPRAQFAFEQTLSDSVKLKTLYTDDVDLCFVFDVDGVTVDVYCNYGSNSVSGYVYAKEAAIANRVLRDHFALKVTAMEYQGSDSVYYRAAA